jgi:hypothetical protein
MLDIATLRVEKRDTGMMMNPAGVERRRCPDRRRYGLAAFWHGARYPRRRAGRRATDQVYLIVDWHSPRVLAVVVAILCLCMLDAIFTVILISHGADELNPVLAPFLPDRLGWFTLVKFTLTGVGVCVLVACSRMRLFRAVPGEWLLYPLLMCYAVLFSYQLELLEMVG